MGSLWAFPNQVVMGLSKKDRRIHLLRKLKYLGQIPVRNGMIYFPEVIYYFSKAVLEAHALGQPRYDKVDLPNSKVRRQAEKEYNRTLRQALRTEVDSHRLDEHWAGSIMVRATKRYLQRKHEKEELERQEEAQRAEEEARAKEMMDRAMNKHKSDAPTSVNIETKNLMDEIGLPPPPRKRKFGPGAELPLPTETLK